MNRFFFVAMPLFLAGQAFAQVSDETSAWMKAHEIGVPALMSQTLQVGLDWLAANDCAAGAKTVATVPMVCAGDKVKDVKEFMKVVPEFERVKYLSPKSLAWLKERKTVMPIPILPNQLKGLNWLLNHDYTPGKLTVGGIEVDVSEDKAGDVDNYLNTVAVTNFSYAMGPADGKPRTNHVEDADPAKFLSPASLAWIKEKKIVMPAPITAPQLEGLEWLLTHDYKAGKLTVAKIDIDAVGDKSTDVGRYLDTVATLNFVEMTK